jgi:glycosidase
MKNSNLKNHIQASVRPLALALGMVFTLSNGLAQAPASVHTAPSWLPASVVYEVFTRQYSPQGNFKAVTASLDELKDLGVNVLWLMPIHPIGEKLRKGTLGSPYAARDYYSVNPDYGDMRDLKQLVSEAHKRGMKVILDVVLLHTGWDNVLMAHPEFYKHDASGKIVPPMPEWTDVAGLNFDNPDLRKYLVAMLKFWVTEADVDGFRCDTASMVPTSFWEQARAVLQQAKPDIMMLAEADKPELLRNAFDIDYAWPLLTALRNVLDKSAPASELQRTWEADRKRYPQGALRLTMSDNHDQARAVARFGIQAALAASALMFTLDGVPLLYNGMEVGDRTESRDPALFSRAPICWQPKGQPQVRDCYRELIRLRKTYPALRSGQVQWLPNSDSNNVVTLLRHDDKDEFLVVINFRNRLLSGNVTIDNPDGFAPLSISQSHPSNDVALPGFRLNGFDWAIYHRSPFNLAKNKASAAQVGN